MFQHREDVAQRLGRVPCVAQPVPDRNTRRVSQLFDVLLGEPAILDAVEHAAQDSAGVLDRLLVPELRAVGVQVRDMCALIMGCHLEGASRARRALGEHQCEVESAQSLDLVVCLLLGLHVLGESKQTEPLVDCEVELLGDAPSAQAETRVERRGGQRRVQIGHDDTSSRTIGQVMQRGPPRPRPSSDPTTGITSMPFSARKLLVVVLRS